MVSLQVFECARTWWEVPAAVIERGRRSFKNLYLSETRESHLCKLLQATHWMEDISCSLKQPHLEDINTILHRTPDEHLTLRAILEGMLRELRGGAIVSYPLFFAFEQERWYTADRLQQKYSCRRPLRCDLCRAKILLKVYGNTAPAQEVLRLACTCKRIYMLFFDFEVHGVSPGKLKTCFRLDKREYS